MTKFPQTECPCCGTKPLPCPFCGKEALIWANTVECSDWECGGSVNWGHWEGESNGIPSQHWVIKQWNKRV